MCDTRLDLSPPTLYDAWRLRQLDPYSVDIEKLKHGRFEVEERPPRIDPHHRWTEVQEKVLRQVDRDVGSNDAYRVLGRYWFNRSVWEKGAEITTVDLERRRRRWLEVCREAQAKVQRIVQERQIVVEVNPTCNRVVGAMAELAEHHVFPLTLDENDQIRREIRVTVNTDDPGIFNTSLAHEFYLLGEIKLRLGMPEARVVEWLEWLRTNGVDYSFVRTLPDKEDPGVSELLELLKQSHRRILRRLDGRRGEFGLWLEERRRRRQLATYPSSLG